MTGTPMPNPGDNHRSVVRALHAARVARKMSLKELARLTGWSDVAIRNMERGVATKFRIVTDCAQALGVVILALPQDAWTGTPQDGQDARAAGRVAATPRKAAGGASTGRETACGGVER